MDAQLAELAALYEIAAFTFSGSERDFFRELKAKAARLFGAGRVVLAFSEDSGRAGACCAWGFPEQVLREREKFLEYVSRRRDLPGVYLRDLGEKGVSGLFFLERKREFADYERRLLDILSGRVAELLQGHLREKKLVYLSTRDALTGLYNRAFFEEELRRLERGRSFPVSLVMCDLDGLKVVNDTFGHEQGDELLRRAAGVLGGCVRGSDVVARVGGDEFVVILPQTDREAAEEVVQRIIEAAERDSALHPDFPLSLSVGAATAEDASRSLQEVYAEADDAMYRNKLARGTGHSHRAAVRALRAALAEKDFAAEGHTERVKRLACMLGEAVGLSRSDLDTLSLLAEMHDLGKLAVPERILFKPSKLTAEEWEEVKRHPEVGYRIAASCPDLAPVAELIRQHHERWDGQGYPRGLRGEEIHILSRILAIADAYDAMTSERPHHRPLPPEEALEELERCAGAQFDPRLVEVFVELERRGSARRH